MRRLTIAAAAVALLSLPAAAPPAQAAAPPLSCLADGQADVTSVVKGIDQPQPVAAPKADLRRFCAGLNERVYLRWRVPGVDVTTDSVWGGGFNHARVVTFIQVPGGPDFEYMIGVGGPVSEGHFAFFFYADLDGDGVYSAFPCIDRTSGYDAVNTVIRISFAASCVGSPESIEAFGQSFRNPDMATPNTYLFDDGNIVMAPPAG